jgi:hypothetical protein
LEVKLFEIRDKATFIPAMAIHLRNRDEAEFYLLRRAGYSAEAIGGPIEKSDPYIILCKLDGVEAQYDSFQWSRGRTMAVAHYYILQHWNNINSGDVIDVEYILGETKQPKQSERVTMAS